MKKITFISMALAFAVMLMPNEILATEAGANDEAAATEKASPWKFSGMFGLNAAQTAFVNWAAGGENNFNANAFANLELNYKMNKFSWQTKFDGDFGKMYQDSHKYTWKKSSDKLNILSTAGWEIAKSWQAAFQASFKSQFVSGYEYKTVDGEEMENRISDFLAPAYVDVSVGINHKPSDKYNLYFSPVAGRITIVNEKDFRTRFGLKDDESAKFTLGMTFTAGCNINLVKDVKLIGSLSMYTPYNADFGNIDTDLTLGISYKFLKLFNISLNTDFKYYDSAKIPGKDGPRAQFKEVVGLGLGYNF